MNQVARREFYISVNHTLTSMHPAQSLRDHCLVPWRTIRGESGNWTVALRSGPTDVCTQAPPAACSSGQKMVDSDL